MPLGNSATGRYQSLRRTGLVLSRMAPLVTFGLWALGLSLFLDQARDLISDAQFTWGERQVMSLVAVVTAGSCVLAGWVVGRLFRAAADMIDVLADLGESFWRTGDLIERHVIPLLGRIATNLEQNSPTQDAIASARTIGPETSPTSKRIAPSQGTSGR